MPRRWLPPLLKIFGRNWITLFGSSVTTVSFMMMLAFILLGALGLANSPYIALMALLVLPGLFVFGLVLIPLGILWERRRVKPPRKAAKRRPPGEYPVIDLNRSRIRRVFAGVGILTGINLLVIGVASYEAVVYMESTEFCGQVCHTVMEPEFAAYTNSPHSRVNCVQCHIGPGAPWFVRSKLSGLGQVLAVTLDSYDRPIPTPIPNLRPSQDTCEQCHWPERFSGDRIRVIRRFSDDEENTPTITVLSLHIGGGGDGRGIHSWHINPNRITRYRSVDEKRQAIGWVQVKEGDHLREFRRGGAEDASGLQETDGEERVMDCIDCHNRPTHIFALPGPAMDEALASGKIDRSIPFIKKVGVEILTEAGKIEALPDHVADRVISYYQETYPDLPQEKRSLVEQAAAEIEQIYQRNVFPEMKLTWGTYANNIGHQDFPGCFRCHDGELSDSDGNAIEQDCEACHSILAWDEENPEILSQLGLE